MLWYKYTQGMHDRIHVSMHVTDMRMQTLTDVCSVWAVSNITLNNYISEQECKLNAVTLTQYIPH